jgi:hypothetical protein
MDDITTMLSQVLSDPAAMQQIQSVAASLGLGGTAPAAEAPAAPDAGSVDLSALSGILGGLLGNAQQSQPAAAPNSTAALAALLGGGNQGGGQAAPGLPFDLGTLLKLQQAMSTITANQANVQLLMALKPRLKLDRAKKVDDAVRVMQLIQFLPLIKESGLFGDLSGGLGGIVSGLGDGLGGMLGGLFGGRRQA